ncbi:MAG: SGNH/GDSL hydrolase family protein [Aquabacterium sp.]|uniref:SGNH/GDSL hydrolase family protein n=1 Tax=Aquabacterium sp. TaxID=1872578 RepID=UPI0025B82160|nr:SGNH/GDSL hydrolase family protein [Aquabacterium sp.]MBI3382483.1 SGNH/GDSL hydrolase family protein [Aquabacterium sp.]
MADTLTRILQGALACALMGSTALSQAADCDKGKNCLFVIGNSLTRHGPSSAIGWQGEWGMAASAADKDYVAQLLKLLNQDAAGASWAAHKEDGGELERHPALYHVADETSRLARQSALVVVEVGDNVDTGKTPLPMFAQAYSQSLEALKPEAGVLACVSTWWPSAEKDQLIKERCEKAGGVFVDISSIARSPKSIARNERTIAHDGVGAHPGDAGMKAIANKIFTVAGPRPSADKAAQPVKTPGKKQP